MSPESIAGLVTLGVVWSYFLAANHPVFEELPKWLIWTLFLWAVIAALITSEIVSDKALDPVSRAMLPLIAGPIPIAAIVYRNVARRNEKKHLGVLGGLVSWAAGLSIINGPEGAHRFINMIRQRGGLTESEAQDLDRHIDEAPEINEILRPKS